jgi:serine/threonine protein kinase
VTSFADQLQAALGPGYQLDRELEGGGMSRVFLATDKTLGRRIVVKVLPPELAAGVNRDRFRREIQLAAQLQHPHIVPLLFAGESTDFLWYTMPYIEGESLRAVLEKERRLPVRDVMRILHDVVDALAYAHLRGVIHRDIKPANILTQGSHALVTDFGVAKALSAAISSGALTTGGIAIGTPAYMAPEQLAGDPSADARMDIYAVGLLAYELLAGTPPFVGASPRETMAAQLTRDPTPPHELRPEVPVGLSTLIMRCLAKDPASRPASAAVVLRELDQLSVTPTTPPESPARPTAGAARGRSAWVAALGTLGVIAAAAIVYTSIGSEERTDLQGLPPDSAFRPIGDSAVGVSAPIGRGSALDSNAPVTLSDEQLRAIARLVTQQTAATRHADSIARVAFEDTLRRRLTDSLRTAMLEDFRRATEQRVVFLEPRPQRGGSPDSRRAMQTITLLGVDSIKRLIDARPQYHVVPRDSVEIVLGSGSRATAPAAGPRRNDVVVRLQLGSLPRDSAVWRITISEPPVPGRGTPATKTIEGPRTTLTGALAILGEVNLLMQSTLDSLRRSRGRGPSGGPVGGPGFPRPVGRDTTGA